VDDAHREGQLADVPAHDLPVDAGLFVDRHPLLPGDVRGPALVELLRGHQVRQRQQRHDE
jgi:hypothetical protein